MPSAALQRLLRGLLDRHGRRLRDGLNRFVARFSLIEDRPVFDQAVRHKCGISSPPLEWLHI